MTYRQLHITFQPLTTADFPLLLKWLETPHVKAWWDQNVHWTLELIREKYGSYVVGYKFENGETKNIHAYIIWVDQTPIGYIQMYNAYDFARSKPLVDLSESLAAVDFFIGEPSVLGQGIGAQVLSQFLDDPVHNQYEYTLVDPDSSNIAAIKTYQKAGFKQIMVHDDSKEIWMLRKSLGQETRLK